MVKGIGILLILATTTLTGRYFSVRAHRRVQELETFTQLFSSIRAQIAYTLTPTLELLYNLQEDLEFKSFRFLKQLCDRLEAGAPLQSAWEQSVAAYKTGSALQAEELQYIMAFGSAFGSTDKEGQQANCAYYIDRLTETKKAVQSRLPNTTKLCTSLGVLTGLFLGILLL